MRHKIPSLIGALVPLAWLLLHPSVDLAQQSTRNMPVQVVELSAANAVPAITTQPTNQTVTVGETATFTVAASGTPAPTFSWQVSTDGGSTWMSLNPAVTTASLIITNATASMNGVLYRAVATNSEGTVTSNPAELTVMSTMPPFGQVDTPLQNATGVVGAIGITGWALDDDGVTSVNIYRNCLSFDATANCQIINGTNVVFIGGATFVAGARPDVEAAYPSYPQANRGGWGYLLLTNMLPHVPNALGYGGQGPLTLYAFATDVEGHVVLLGRSTADQTPTAITMANDTIAKPFGTLDTPAQGATVNGTLVNFGWVLTPDSNATVDSTDILIPTDGSTTFVYIDGMQGPTVAYNQCRGTVNNPVPAGVFCNDDVANIFGNATPQAAFTTRTANATKYRNLDAGRGAIGAFFGLDTNTLTNGLHTISWVVTDSAGRADGIGSRFFTVFNAGSDPSATANASAMARGTASSLATLAPTSGTVWGRTGFDPTAPWLAVAADRNGVRDVQLPDLGLLELWLGPTDAGYLVANNALRDLPPGSHLDPVTGDFTWAPGPGYFGTYRLAFVQGGAQMLVDVTIRPIVSDPSQSQVRMFVDAPTDRSIVSGPITIAGWALDPQAAIGSGIDAVHVWATKQAPTSGVVSVGVPPEMTPEVVSPQFLGAAALDGARPDVASAFGAQFSNAGYALDGAILPPGVYDVTIYVHSARTGQWEDARTISVTMR